MSRCQTSESSPSVASILLGVLVGAVSGTLLGILFAPRSGKVTQAAMQDSLLALVNKLPDPSKEAASSAMNVNGKARTLFLKTRVNLEAQVDRVSKALQSSKLAKAKAKEALNGNDDAFLDN
jgi:gas vesicle protein